MLGLVSRAKQLGLLRFRLTSEGISVTKHGAREEKPCH